MQTTKNKLSILTIDNGVKPLQQEYKRFLEQSIPDVIHRWAHGDMVIKNREEAISLLKNLNEPWDDRADTSREAGYLAGIREAIRILSSNKKE